MLVTLVVGLVGHHVTSAVVVSVAAHALIALQRIVLSTGVLRGAVGGRVGTRVRCRVGAISTASAARGIAMVGPTGRMMRTAR